MGIGLGTAQFGLTYGLPGAERAPDAGRVNGILSQAVRSGIELLDTAPIYGEAEGLVGESGHAQSFRVVTKLPPTELAPAAWRESVAAGLRSSLGNLKLERVHGLLVHDAGMLLGSEGDRLRAGLEALRDAGLVTKIGVSVYDAAQIEAVWERHPLDLVQLPFSVLDQRLFDSGHLAELARRGVEIHARSALLKGLVLSGDRPPACFAHLTEHLVALERTLAGMGRTPLQGAIGFALARPEIHTVLLGVDGPEQLAELCAAQDLQREQPLDADLLRDFALTDENVLNPSLWPR